MLHRTLEASVGRSATQYPAVLIAGPRQSGKTTLARRAFGHLDYVNLESPIERADALSDPLGFLARFPKGAILDEVQNTPELLSYLQVRIDEEGLLGRWVLTGSQQMELASGASQSLAGRIAIHHLFPFALDELEASPRRPRGLDQAVFMGGYPPLFDERRGHEPAEWLESYLETFVQRDVRSALDVRNPSEFDRFLRLCAARTGQELNLSDFARDCDVDHKTVKRWIGVLEGCFVLRLLRPYYRNFGKRLVKRPKLHFVDTGLACRLVRIADVDQLSTHPLRGSLVETWCHNELVKFLAHRGRHDPLWFWRTNDGIEFDVLLELRGKLIPIEIKASMTPQSGLVSKAERLAGRDLAQEGLQVGRPISIYGGDQRRTGTAVDHVPWHSIAAVMGELI